MRLVAESVHSSGLSFTTVYPLLPNYSYEYVLRDLVVGKFECLHAKEWNTMLEYPIFGVNKCVNVLLFL